MRHQTWMYEAAYFAGILALLTLPFRTDLWLPSLIGAILTHLFIVCVVSVGNHRLFCHNSFKTSKFWRIFLMYASVFAVYGSPIQWAAMHHSHHVHSDTELDPNPKPDRWSILWRLSYSSVPPRATSSRRLISDSGQVFLHRNYVLILLAGFVGALALSYEFFFNVYLPGLGLFHLVTRLHILFAHHGDKPRNLAFLEFLVPAGGEWYHKQHHETPGSWRFGRWDLSAAIVKLIRTEGKPTIATRL